MTTSALLDLWSQTGEADQTTLEFHEQTAAAGWRGVFCEGPEADQDPAGEEIPMWVVYVGDEEADPVGQVYTVHAYRAAVRLAARIAEDRRLELVNEAMPA